MDFRGALAVNGTNQRVLAIFTEPELEYEQDENGTIWLLYKGKTNGSELVIKGTATVDVNYDTQILSDSVPPSRNLSVTNLTGANADISLQARALADKQSSLRTIVNLVNWVHKTVEYDVAYWEEAKSAEEVFRLRRGVCVEYTHLLISMARSLGFETRYVSGYVFANTWQPHAWAEIDVPGYGWLPADATFGQVGILDNSHLTIDYGRDQSDIYDLLICENENATLKVQDRVTPIFFSEEANPASLRIDFDDETLVVDVTMSNNRPEYLYGSYNFVVPSSHGQRESSVVLLRPKETLHAYHGLNHSLFESRFSYLVPVSASFNGAKAEKTLNITADGSTANGQKNSYVPAPCAVPALLLGLLISRAVI